MRKSWTSEEDEDLIEIMKQFKDKSPIWVNISKQLASERSGKQCRERWINHIDPSIDKTPWTSTELELIESKQFLYGNKWIYIASLLPGRTEMSVKNLWFSKHRRQRRKRSDPIFTPLELKDEDVDYLENYLDLGLDSDLGIHQ